MISRDQLRELAEVESSERAAVSFYFQPLPPQNKSHKEELILVKDLVRAAMKQSNGAARADLERIFQKAEQLHANHSRGKAIFACASRGVWREFNLPPLLGSSAVTINSRFRLSPMLAALNRRVRCVVALIDREKAFVFSLGNTDLPEEVTSLEQIVSEVPRRVRTEGFAGYEAGHIERHIDNEATRHFKRTAERLKEIAETRGFQHFAIGCRDEIWSEIESHLHPYVRQRLLGHFPADPAMTTAAHIREEVDRLFAERRASERAGLVREVLGEAQRNGRGVAGLRSVLLSLERGEVQTLLVGNNFTAPGVECRNCGHLDTRTGTQCDVCGHETRELEDLADALVSRTIRAGSVEIVHIAGVEEFERAGNIAALLRFRADQNTAQKLAG